MVSFNRLLSSALLAITLIAPCGLLAQSLQHRPENPSPELPQSKNEPPSADPTKPVLPSGTCLQVEITRNYPMKTGVALEGRLVYPVYFEGRQVVPANTPVRGIVAELQPDRKARWRARLRGDLTPFHIAKVRFDQLALPEGLLALQTNRAVSGAPVLFLYAPGAAPKRSFIGKYWGIAKKRLHEQVAFFTDPGLGQRALDMVYHQLPYHPEHIPAHTAWTFELASPLALSGPPEGAEYPAPPTTVPGGLEVWSVRALLTSEVTSATAKPGDAVQALVVEPVFAKEQHLVVPQ